MKKNRRKKVFRINEDEAHEKLTPRTVENSRPIDETMLNVGDEETKVDLENDEFKDFWNSDTDKPQKVLITTSDNPHSRTIQLCRELKSILPKSEFRFRNRSSIKKIIRGCTERGYSNLIVINENRREPNAMLLVRLPEGPTAKFRLSSVKLSTEIPHSRKPPRPNRPELILNNFSTRLGYSIGRLFATLFPKSPKFKCRTVCTFHNQRDFIFFRYHHYDVDDERGNVSLRESGPQMTLKLMAFQSGLFDPHGEYEWVLKRHEMQKDRKRFYIG